MELRESVHSIGSDIAAVDQVEDLAEDESVPDQSEVDHLLRTIEILVNGLSSGGVRQIEDRLACEHDHHHYCGHEDGHAEDLAVHCGGHNIGTCVIHLRLLGWTSRGEGESAEDIHDQVDVDKLRGIKCALSHGAVADDHDDNEAEVAGNLELQEAANVHVDVASPLNGLQA